jgi:hypothetical protein
MNLYLYATFLCSAIRGTKSGASILLCRIANATRTCTSITVFLPCVTDTAHVPQRLMILLTHSVPFVAHYASSRCLRSTERGCQGCPTEFRDPSPPQSGPSANTRTRPSKAPSKCLFRVLYAARLSFLPSTHECRVSLASTCTRLVPVAQQ